MSEPEEVMMAARCPVTDKKLIKRQIKPVEAQMFKNGWADMRGKMIKVKNKWRRADCAAGLLNISLYETPEKYAEAKRGRIIKVGETRGGIVTLTGLTASSSSR